MAVKRNTKTTVKRNAMAQALTVPPVATNAQGATVQRVNPVAGTSYSDATNRLRSGQEITESAIQGRGFDPRGGIGVAVAQIATAGIGAWAQNTARKELAEIEVNRQNKLSSLLTSKGYTPESASAIASMTTPESGSSIIGSFISQDMAKNDPATQLSLQKSQAEISKLNAETNKVNREAAGVGSPDIAKVFDNTSKLRESLINNSKEFQGIKAGFEKVKISASDPSPAGDISMIFAFMKTLDPNSTVREGEAATVANAGSIDSRTASLYNRTLSGEKLPPEVRADFVDRATKLYNQAAKSQEKTNNQYRKIAIRNKLNPEDVIVDFTTTLEQPPAQLSGQSIAPQQNVFKVLNVRDR
jgi:hypothetical protein